VGVWIHLAWVSGFSIFWIKHLWIQHLPDSASGFGILGVWIQYLGCLDSWIQYLWIQHLLDSASVVWIQHLLDSASRFGSSSANEMMADGMSAV
jgi:hypothetical protein